MIKEATRFEDSTVFEGMTSIRAIIKGLDCGDNSRHITTILYDKDKKQKNLINIQFLLFVMILFLQ